jgi:hypothetical protein
MQDITQLKRIVIESFEAKGILSEIRAQIRASVFKAVEETENEQNTANFEWERKNPLEITENSDKLILAILINDFLTHMDLQYTSNVFSHESNLKLKSEDKESQMQLLRSAGIDPEKNTEPLLYQLLRKMNKQHNPESTPNPEQEQTHQEPNHTQNIPQNNPITNLSQSENINKTNQIQRRISNPHKSTSFGLQRNEPNVEHHTMMNNIELNEFGQMEGPRVNVEEGDLNEMEQHEDPNQMYLSEPVVLDVTADSDLLKEFDHEESVEDVLFEKPGEEEEKS